MRHQAIGTQASMNSFSYCQNDGEKSPIPHCKCKSKRLITVRLIDTWNSGKMTLSTQARTQAININASGADAGSQAQCESSMCSMCGVSRMRYFICCVEQCHSSELVPPNLSTRRKVAHAGNEGYGHSTISLEIEVQMKCSTVKPHPLRCLKFLNNDNNQRIYSNSYT